MKVTNFAELTRDEKRMSKKDDYASIVRNRFALLGYDDYSYSGADGNSNGDALSSILKTVGQVGTAFANSQAGYPTPTPTQTLVSSNISAHAPSMGNNSLLLIVGLIIAGILAYREL